VSPRSDDKLTEALGVVKNGGKWLSTLENSASQDRNLSLNSDF
jgi:hypothetical protein